MGKEGEGKGGRGREEIGREERGQEGREVDRIALLVSAMNMTAERARSEATASRAAEIAPKLPSKNFQHSTARFKLLAKVPDKKDLPPIYQEMANITKNKMRATVNDLAEARVQDVESLTQFSPIVTVELMDFIQTANDAPPMHLINMLEKGINLLTIG